MLELGTLMSAVTAGTTTNWTDYNSVQSTAEYPIADELQALFLCTFRRYQVQPNRLQNKESVLAELTPDNLCRFQQTLYEYLLAQQYPVHVTVEHVYSWMKHNVDHLESARRLVLECFFREREAETVDELKIKLETFLVDPISEESHSSAVASLKEGLTKCYSLPIFNLIKKWSMKHALDIDTVVEYFGERYLKSLVASGFFELFGSIDELVIWVNHTEPLTFSKTLVSARTAQKCLVNHLSSLMDDETRLFYALSPNPSSTFDVCMVVEDLLLKDTLDEAVLPRHQLIADLHDLEENTENYVKWGRQFITACMTDASFQLEEYSYWQSLLGDLYHMIHVDVLRNHLIGYDIDDYESCLRFFKFFNKWLVENDSQPKTTLKRTRDDSDSEPDSVKRHKSDFQIYTDGSYTQPYYSGIGIYFGEGDSRNVSEPVNASSAIHAEMMAIEQALKLVAEGSFGTVEIFTDSLFTIKYVYGGREALGITQQYVYQINKLLVKFRGRVTLSHVKAHSGNKGNDQAHKLAWEGRKKGMRKNSSD